MRIKKKLLLIGLGWAGCNLLQKEVVRSLPKLFVDTDKQICTLDPSLLIGNKSLEGRGTGGGVALGKKSIDESFGDVLAAVGTRKKVLIVASMRGGTGGSAAYLALKLIEAGIDTGLMWVTGLLIETPLMENDVRYEDLEKIQSRLFKLKLIADTELNPPISKSQGLDGYMRDVEESLLQILLGLTWKAGKK